MRIPSYLRVNFFKEAIRNGMKVLTYDIETSHMLVRTFYIGPQVNIMHKQVKVPSKVITVQYKWFNERKAKYLEWDKIDNVYDDIRNFDDSNMIEEFTSNILKKADIVIGQNTDRFDFLVLNERAKASQLQILDLKPSIDILKLSRKSFRAASHKLDYRSEQLGYGGKLRMMDDDWVDVEERGISVTKKMVPYGLKDVRDTENLFIKELPYYKDLPLIVEKTIMKFIKTVPVSDMKLSCPECVRLHRHSKNLAKKEKVGYLCLNCGFTWSNKPRSSSE